MEGFADVEATADRSGRERDRRPIPAAVERATLEKDIAVTLARERCARREPLRPDFEALFRLLAVACEVARFRCRRLQCCPGKYFASSRRAGWARVALILPRPKARRVGVDQLTG